MDDTFQNVKDVASVYKNTKNVQVISLHYLRMQKHKAAFLTGKNAKKLQAEATEDWQNFRAVAKKDLPGFSL